MINSKRLTTRQINATSMNHESTTHDPSIDVVLIEAMKQYDKRSLQKLFTRYRSHLIADAFESLVKRTVAELALAAALEIVLEVFHDLWLERQNINPRADIYQKLKKDVRVKCSLRRLT